MFDVICFFFQMDYLFLKWKLQNITLWNQELRELDNC
jgi:hypothetical protein